MDLSDLFQIGLFLVLVWLLLKSLSKPKEVSEEYLPQVPQHSFGG